VLQAGRERVPARFPLGRGIVFLSIAMIWLLTVAIAIGEDTVTVATGANRRGRSKQTGEVLEYTGDGLVLKTSRGRKTTIDAELVINIETTKSPLHRKGDLALASRDYDGAISHYNAAVLAKEEHRGWVQRMMLASLLRCYQATVRHDEAGRLFAQLVEADPKTPYLDTIPLAWSTGQRAGDRQITTWMSSRQHAVRLLGASYALSTPRRELAIKVLEQLTADENSTLRRLAQAQIWRTRIPQPNDDVDDWESVIQQLPASLQAGPYYVWGQALAVTGQHERAALAQMRVRILFDASPPLAAEAMLQAGKSLAALENFEDASRVYAEIITDFPKTDAAAEAKQHIETLNSQPKKPT